MSNFENNIVEDTKYSNYLQLLSDYLLENYGLQTIYDDVVDEDFYMGSYDGSSIIVKNSLSHEYKLFLVAHLFGHTIQWNHNFCKYKAIEQELPINKHGELTKSQLNKLKSYEYEAAGYSIYILSESLGVDLSQWFSDWSNADWEYFIALSDLNNKHNTEIKVKYGSKLIPKKRVPQTTRLRKFNRKYAY